MNNRLSKSALAMAIALAMLAGKPVFSEAGEKIGKVQDLIIAPEHALSYVIVGAGGFIGIGRHDVAVPVAQIEERTNRLVMSGATRESISAMPTFVYAGDTGQRDRFVARAERDIAHGKARVAAIGSFRGQCQRGHGQNAQGGLMQPPRAWRAARAALAACDAAQTAARAAPNLMLTTNCQRSFP